MAMEIAVKYGIEAIVIQALYIDMEASKWKKVIADAVFYQWQQTLIDNALKSSSLVYFDTKRVTVMRPHHVWPLKGDSRLRTAATYRAKMLSGSYILQTNRAKFNQNTIDPTCVMCNNGDEDMPHFLTECTALEECRNSILPQLISMFDDSVCTENIHDLTMDILNCGPQLKTSSCP